MRTVLPVVIGRSARLSVAALALSSICVSGALPALASTIAPPMLDITHQCDVTSRRSVRAMSECVVAESEARAEVLQKWDKLSDASADKCIRLGLKAKKFPYGVLAKCVALEPVDMQAAARPPIVSTPEEVSAHGGVTDWFLKTTGIRK